MEFVIAIVLLLVGCLIAVVAIYLAKGRPGWNRRMRMNLIGLSVGIGILMGASDAKDDGEVMTLLAGAVIVFCMGSIMFITRERLREHRSKSEREGRIGGDGINERHDYTDL